MLRSHLLGGDEGDGGVVVREVIRHLHDLLLNEGEIGAVFRYDIAVAPMHRASRQLDVVAGLDGVDGLPHRQCVLPRVRDAGDAADRVRVPLGDAGAPEGRGGAVG